MPGRFKMVFLPPQDDQTRGWAAGLAAVVARVDVVVVETDADAAREVRDADAVLGAIPPALLAEATRLRWLQVPQIAPPPGYYYPELVAHPCVATNFRGVFNDHIAAHIMAFVLALSRGLQFYLPRQLRREYRPEPLNTGTVYLPEASALIVGLGGIGTETARRLSDFGVGVIGVDTRPGTPPRSVTSVHPPADLDRLLPDADFVIVTVPDTPETEGMFDAARFARMKRSDFFINIGRGPTTRLEDLDDALRRGVIAGAALDVFEVEPLPTEHPLWGAPNLLLTPHTSGYGPHLDERRIALIATNARRFAAGRPLVNVVDKERWY